MLSPFQYIQGKYDPFHLNAIFFDSKGFEKQIPKEFSHVGLRKCIFDSLRLVYYNIKKNIRMTPPKYKMAGIENYKDVYDNTLLFFLTSINNQRAFEEIINKIYVREKQHIYIIKHDYDVSAFPLFWIWVVAICFLPVFWFRFLKKTRTEKLITLYYLHEFVIAPGMIWFFFNMFRRYRPKCVLMANDHSMSNKALELVCEDYGIKTIYVQHASVSFAFPELHFSYSFLDGRDTLLKYVDGEKKCIGKVFLLGAIRYDKLSSYRKNRSEILRNRISIAINILDDNYIVNSLCNMILSHYPNIELKIRSHPTMKGHPFVFDNKERIINTCAADEDIIDYLDSIDVQIANDSGIHFDVIEGGVKSIVYNFSTKTFGDNYNYVKQGLIPFAENEQQLFSYLDDKQFKIETETVRFYDESYGKSYEGKSSEIVADFILNGFNVEYLKDHYGLIQCEYEKGNYYKIEK